MISGFLLFTRPADLGLSLACSSHAVVLGSMHHGGCGVWALRPQVAPAWSLLLT